MFVYRFMSKEELDTFLAGDMKRIGNTFPKHCVSNTFSYKPGEKYVHMFRDLKDFDCIKNLRHFEYFVVFDIPMITLMTSMGKGFYKDKKNKKKGFKYVREFAINGKRMLPDYLVDYVDINIVKNDKDILLDFISECKKIKKCKKEFIKIC